MALGWAVVVVLFLVNKSSHSLLAVDRTTTSIRLCGLSLLSLFYQARRPPRGAAEDETVPQGKERTMPYGPRVT